MRNRLAILGMCFLALVSASVTRVARAALAVRPGTFADGCTLGFLFEASDGNRYMAIAGHCFLDDGTERVWEPGSGPVVTVSGQRIGEAAYAIWNQNDLNPLPDATDPTLPLPADFALVRLDDSVGAIAAVCHFGGPSGVNETSDPVAIVHYFGNGEVIGSIQETATATLSARTAPATGFDDPRAIALHGPVGPGDSGAPVLDDQGRAVGILSHLGSPDGSSFAPVSRLGPHVDRAQDALDLTLELQTAPTLGATPFGSDC